jgi:pimeloyl-ACP methyl ester carboxylesterase
MSSALLLAVASMIPLAEPTPPAPLPRVVGELVELQTPTGALYGTIDLPARPGPWPVVLIHPGSGPTDRDGNSRLSLTQVLQNDSLKLLGRALAGRGVAALRIDKRGIGASVRAMVKERDLRVETYADDAAAWLAFLKRDPRFTRIGVIGHSEGTLIGLMAAKQTPVDAVVCLCGLARPLQDVLRVQLKGALSKELYDSADAILTELAAGREVPKDDVPASLASLFRPSVQPYLISEFKLDPAKIVANMTAPVLVVSGTTDIQLSLEDGKRLAEARPGVKVLVLDQMNHVLKQTALTSRLEQLPLYSDPTLPLHPGLVDGLVDFLTQSFGK